MLGAVAQVHGTSWRKRVPGGGGSAAGPAKHCAIDIQRLAVGPTTQSPVSATFRTWVTTWQNSLALPSTRSSSRGSFHSQSTPEGAASRGHL